MEKMRFEGKVVIVTGASSGIGRSTARLFAMEGAKVVAAARRLKRLEDLRDKVAAENAPGVILPVKTDVRDPAQIEAMFDTCLKEFGHLDILVNNAGVLDGQLPIHETPQEVYDMIYETNQRAVYLCCQRAIKIFLEQGTPANIVNVASAASLRGLKGGAMYVMTKHAVLGLTRNISASFFEESPEAAATESAPDAELPPGAKPLFLNDPPPEAPQPREVPPEKHIYPDAPFNGDWPTEILGVLDDTYILCAGRTGLVMIDQHAAHERIMFEHLLKAARTGVPAQPLLLPQLLELPATMSSLLLRNRKVFEVLGFDIEPMGSTSVMLNALPMEMPTHRPLNELIPDMLQELLDNMANKMPVELEYVARAACHAAIKAHDRLSPEGARELLRQLGECRQGTLCPHGRPTMVTVTFKEIEKRFGRR